MFYTTARKIVPECFLWLLSLSPLLSIFLQGQLFFPYWTTKQDSSDYRTNSLEFISWSSAGSSCWLRTIYLPNIQSISTLDVT